MRELGHSKSPLWNFGDNRGRFEEDVVEDE